MTLRKKSKSKIMIKDDEDSIKHVIDPKYCNKQAKGYDLPVYLKKTEKKGTSLFANKNIPKGTTVAFYKVKVYHNNYKQKFKGMYAIDVNGYMGDLYKDSLPEPLFNIPFWGHFSNEPSLNQKANIIVKINTPYKEYYSKKPGDTMIFKLVTSEDVKKGDELMWCYGKSYIRNYQTVCS